MNYNKLTPFKWYVLENFPFIEADFDAITNYQLFSKVVEYLNKTMNKTNELGKKVEEIVNYFNNLDVQDEINNKLDEMVKDGSLEIVISKYFNIYTTPEDFGAIGDGITDDSTAILNAINYGSDNNIPIIFKNKTYLCNISVTKSNIKIIGNNAILKANNNSTIPILAFTNENDIKNISIFNLNIDGNKDNILIVKNSNCHGLTFTNAENILIKNINIFNVFRCSIFLSNVKNYICDNFKSVNCGITTSEQGCVLTEIHGSENLFFKNISFANYFGEGFLIRNTNRLILENFYCSTGLRLGNNAFTTDDCFNIEIINFNINNINHQGIEINSTENFSIKNGKINNCLLNGLLISNFSTVEDKKSINGKIENIIFENNNLNNNEDAFDIYVIGSEFLNILNNTIDTIKLSYNTSKQIKSKNIILENNEINIIRIIGSVIDGIKNIFLNNNNIITISNDIFASFYMNNKCYLTKGRVLNTGNSLEINLPIGLNSYNTGLLYISSYFPSDPAGQFNNKILMFSIMGNTNNTQLISEISGNVKRDVNVEILANNKLKITNNTGVQLLVSVKFDYI